MTSNGSAPITPAEIARVVEEEFGRLPADVRNGMSLEPIVSGIERSAEGDWTVPVSPRTNGAVPGAYTLHRVLSDLQHRVELRTKAFVNILLAA